MECDKCGREVRFPIKYAQTTRFTSSYGVKAEYLCEEYYVEVTKPKKLY